MDRRHFTISAAAGLASPSLVFAQTCPGPSYLSPFNLTIERDSGWKYPVTRLDCILGELWDHQGSRSDGRSTKLCQTLELPYRGNQREISAIEPGWYCGRVLTDGPLGWRIALDGVTDRDGIRLHIGNRPNDSTGCILPGTQRTRVQVADPATGRRRVSTCAVAGSRTALRRILSAYGTDTRRPISIHVV